MRRLLALVLPVAMAYSATALSDTLKAPAGHLRENGRDCLKCHESKGAITPRSHASVRFAREGHARQALREPERCASCHRDRECLQCHRGRLSVRIHVPGYRYAHARDAKQGNKNCGLCHSVDRYCGSCHQ